MNELLRARAAVSGGVFTATDALDCGYDRHSLSRLSRTQAVVRIGRGTCAIRESYAALLPSDDIYWRRGPSFVGSPAESRQVTTPR